ncbi:MAG: pyrroline-5-carboxylate reductase [Actinobacteria bacterium]|nr:pyrroline-5-carboxylate reductase [Actinomycetota bacterium]
MGLKYKLGFIGAGNMALAIADGVVKAGLYRRTEIIASDIAVDSRELFSEQIGVVVTDQNNQVMQQAELVVLAIKPQQAKAVLAPLAGLAGAEQLIVSIMAGVSTSTIEGILGPEAVVVRVMPNLAISVGAGMTAIAKGSRASDEPVDKVQNLFQACGQTVLLEEKQMHAVTAVSGSGPAYFFYFVEAIIKAAQQAGLSRQQAESLAKQTCLGAAKSLLESEQEPAELRRAVTSKGGTTAAALAVMEDAKLEEIISKAVMAAVKRSEELEKSQG